MQRIKKQRINLVILKYTNELYFLFILCTLCSCLFTTSCFLFKESTFKNDKHIVFKSSFIYQNANKIIKEESAYKFEIVFQDRRLFFDYVCFNAYQTMILCYNEDSKYRKIFIVAYPVSSIAYIKAVYNERPEDRK